MSSIGDLVARLVADTSQFKSGLATAKADLSAFASTVGSSLAGLAASFASVGFAKEAIGAAESDIQASKKLNAVLAATGHVAGVTGEEINKLAGDLQRVTKFEDDATVGAAAIIGTFKNIRGENFKDAIRLAQDMAVVLDIDLSMAAKKLGKELKGIAPEEVGNKLALMNSKFGGAAEASVTATEKINLAVGELTEGFGKKLLPAVELVSELIVPAMYDAADGTSTWTNTLLDAMVPVKSGLESLLEMIGLINDGMGNLQNVKEKIAVDWNPDGAAADVEQAFAEGGQNLFEGSDEEFHRRMRAMKNEIDLLRGDATHAEVEFRKALDAGFSPEQAERIKQQVELLDGLKELERQSKEDGKKLDAVGGPDMKTNVAALQHGSSEALSAIFKAMNPDSDLQKKSLDTAQQQLAVLEDVRDSVRGDTAGSVAIYAGSLA